MKQDEEPRKIESIVSTIIWTNNKENKDVEDDNNKEYQSLNEKRQA